MAERMAAGKRAYNEAKEAHEDCLVSIDQRLYQSSLR
jgi:hypothetical protein